MATQQLADGRLVTRVINKCVCECALSVQTSWGQMEPQMPGMERSYTGNERSRNDFDPPVDEEINPRRRAMEGSREDELQLKSMREEDDSQFYRTLTKFLEEETTAVDLPGMVTDEEQEEFTSHRRHQDAMAIPRVSGLRQQVEDDEIPRYVEQFRGHVQGDMVTLEQDELGQQQMKRFHKRLPAAFQKAESYLVKAVKTCQGEVTAQYGELREWGSKHGLDGQVDWTGTPQPVEVRLRCLRGVRDKLPSGRYTLRVSLHSRLGGRVLHRSAPRVTTAVQHDGHFLSAELPFHQSVCTKVEEAHVFDALLRFPLQPEIRHLKGQVLPRMRDMQPGMVFVFELGLHSGTALHATQFFAWGAFPICNLQLEAVEGKFKCPLLSGHYSSRIDQFGRFEASILSDLDNWLCNLYFEVLRLQQDVATQEVTLQMAPQDNHTSDCFYPTGRAEEDHHRGHNAPELCPQRSAAWLSTSCPGEESQQVKPKCPPRMTRDAHLPAGLSSQDLRPRCSTESASPLRGEDPIGRRPPRPLPEDDFDEYSFSVRPRHSQTGGADGRIADCTRFILVGLLSQLVPSRCSLRHVVLVTLPLAVMWFGRLYLHYASQWLLLQAIGAPVNRVRVRLYTVELSYQSSLLRAREELAMVLVGPLTLNAVVLLMVLIRCGCQLAFDSLPSLLSNSIMAMGLWTALDPLAVFLVDAILGNLSYSAEKPTGDAAKLYWHFKRTQGSGVPGVFITLFLYIVLLICSLTILYIYLVRLHHGGRMLDVFQRLTAEEDAFFVPFDLEVSNQELSYIVKKAEQWRGASGERRKVAVYDDVSTEGGPSRAPGHPSEREEVSATHVSIFTLHLDGFKSLHRHFLRLPDGAVLEVLRDSHEITGLQVEVTTGMQKHFGETEKEPALRKRKKKAVWRSPRVKPTGTTRSESKAELIASRA
ncbi:uncharacterized protein ofcc1 [Polypterus senegalus]|uniref:uncharacterized protein ofcc1 n=1 Tax=Polypterus senegalus TaxID=55291 RepID=UPI00196370D4|nr:uncharacterized protein ofcc1 [Polypterus senegalus]